MKTAVKLKLSLLFGLILGSVAISLLLIWLFRPEAADPHEGQVYIDDGFGMVWITPLEGVPVNTLSMADFRITDGKPYYTGQDFQVRRGVDVSEHQEEINWELAGQADLDYAYIRAGYRGYTEGGLFEDPYFKANIKGALDSGLDVGVYFFSQAISAQEAVDEADFLLELLEGYRVTLPVIYDWEKIEGGGARTDDLSSQTLTECALAFCQTVQNAGYEPGVYFNRYLGYYGYDLSQLTDYSFWVAVPGQYPDFYYAADMWQYSFEAEVPGIETPTDMNLLFIPLAAETPAPSETGEEAE